MNLAFIGLGNMGAPIARNLIRAGHSVTGYNRSRERATLLQKDGAAVAETPGAAAAQAEVVVTMLADDRAVEDVVFGAHGVLSALATGAIHLGMSTISVALSQRLEREHKEHGQHYVAAPVFGRPDAAAAAKLWVVAAGPDPAVARCLPLLQAVGQGVHRLGEQPHLANLVKLSGNFLIMSMIEALGEAFALTRKAGIDPKDFHAVLGSLLGGAPIMARYAAMIAEESYESAGFKLRLGLKDVRLVLEASESSAVPMPLAGLVRDSFLQAISHGLGDADWGAMALSAAERAGLPTTSK